MSELRQIVCPYDHVVNRVPVDRLADNPKCGKCHRPLFTGEPLELTVANFDRHAVHGDVSLLVDFWAGKEWTAKCDCQAGAGPVA